MAENPNPTLIPGATWSELDAVVHGLSREQQLWLSGYLAGLAGGGGAPAAEGPASSEAASPREQAVTILYGTESGNAEELAHLAGKQAGEKGIRAKVVDMADYPRDQLGEEENLLVLVSTWGDGDPPDSAVEFYEWLHSESAPRLEGMRFSVLALGDTSYERFCQTGKDFDSRLEALGAERVYPRKDCDVDFEAPFEEWLSGALPALVEAGNAAASPAPAVGAAVSAPAAPPPKVDYSRKHPFVAELRERILLNGTGSAKEIYHLEFSLAGSGITYEPGDSLGVVPQNNPRVVDAILEQAGIDPRATVESGPAEKPLRDALIEDYEITVVTQAVFRKYAELTGNARMREMLEDSQSAALKDWLYGKQLADLVFEYPADGIDLEGFISLLRKLPPRLYSIASSLKAHPEEVHLTVGAVRYSRHGLPLDGVASSYLADRVAVGEGAPVYIQANRSFNLPEDPETPIIMVGPGTGIAPFRAFVEERKATGAPGKNWLFFGDQHFSTDFLYQLEWQDYLKDGVLTRLNTAFSRDQPHKIYVQNRMREEAKALYAWLEDGAAFYVCGDAARMAKDVHQALIDIAAEQGGKSPEQAEAWVKQIQKEKRYQKDVY